MSVTIRQLARHTSNQPSAPLKLRKMLRRETGNLHLRVRTAPFSIMTHNMALLRNASFQITSACMLNSNNLFKSTPEMAEHCSHRQNRPYPE
jgi:hypothetical protein